MAKSEQLNELALALSKVQGAIEGAKKDSVNPFHKSKYADLTSCWECCREELAKNQIAVVQGGDDTDTHLAVTTTLIHSSGQWIDGTYKMERKLTDKDKNRRDMTAQEIGATITYLRRYSICSLVGICPDDDDANSITPTAKRKDVEDVEPVQQIKNMSASQVSELESILKQCSPQFVQYHAAQLRDTFKVATMHQIAESNYLLIKDLALKDREEFQKKKIEALADLSKNGVK